MTTADTKTLAEHAFDIYDQEGEEAMLAFILKNEIPPDNKDDMESGFYELNDGTVIQHTGDQYLQYVTVHTETQAQRPAAIPIDKQPGLLEREIPLLPRPNSGDIIDMIMATAESQAREEVGLIYDDNLLDLYQVVVLMPSLPAALRTAIGAQNQRPMDRYNSISVDNLIQHCTKDTLAAMPPSEYDKLVRAAKQKLEERGWTDETQPTSKEDAAPGTPRRG